MVYCALLSNIFELGQMTVLVVHPINDKGVDISGARAYGELKFINPRYVYIDELETDNTIPTAFLNRMLKAVDEFDWENDYLLIAGDHLQLVAVSALLASRWGEFMVLRYDRQACGYAEITIKA